MSQLTWKRLNLTFSLKADCTPHGNGSSVSKQCHFRVNFIDFKVLDQIRGTIFLAYNISFVPVFFCLKKNQSEISYFKVFCLENSGMQNMKNFIIEPFLTTNMTFSPKNRDFENNNKKTFHMSKSYRTLTLLLVIFLSIQMGSEMTELLYPYMVFDGEKSNKTSRVLALSLLHTNIPGTQSKKANKTAYHGTQKPFIVVFAACSHL